MKLSLCLLTWNEVHGCRQVIPILPQHLFSDVFAIDGGSTDGTVEYLTQFGIRVISQTMQGYNAAYIEALGSYCGDGVVFYHPKGTIDVGSLPLIVDDLRSGHDLVVASRMRPDSRNEEDDRLLRHRKWFGHGLSYAAAFRWRNPKVTRITDPLHGYRGMSRKFAESLRLQPTGVTADLEMIRHAYKTGAKVSEISVIEDARTIGGSHFPAYATGKKLLRYLVTTP